MPRPETTIQHSKPWLTEQDTLRVNSVIKSGMISHGKRVTEFEDAVCTYLKAESGIATTSGTMALILALQVLRVGPGDEIIVPTYVCRSVMDAVLYVGAKPVLCDVNQHWLITEKEVIPHLSSRTRAIIAVHIFGFIVDIPALKKLKVPIIEDACQAFGFTSKGKKAGTFGDLGVLSFHATKCLTTAEGGMLLVNNHRLIDDAKALNQAVPQPFSDLQAVLGLSQLSRYNEFLDRRARIKKIYESNFKEHNILPGTDNNETMLFRFPLLTDYPFKSLREKLHEKKICIRQGVDQLLHRSLGLPDDLFPNAVAAYNRTISIPFYPALDESEVVYIIQEIKEVLVERSHY